MDSDGASDLFDEGFDPQKALREMGEQAERRSGDTPQPYQAGASLFLNLRMHAHASTWPSQHDALQHARCRVQSSCPVAATPCQRRFEACLGGT